VFHLSRREFLAAATGAVGGGLVAACAIDHPSTSQSSPSASTRPSSTQSSSPQLDTKSVLVVGAGMAGLAAAHSLIDAGWPVRLIEARDRVGGRINTSRDWGVPLEMGASWIHGTKGNPVMELAHKARLELAPTDYYRWAKLAIDPKLGPLRYDQKAWRQFVQRASDEADGGSLGGSLGAAVNAAAADEGLSAAERAQLAFYLTTEIADEYAADADQLSATTYDDGDYTEGDQNAVTNGYDAVPKLLADGLSVVLNTPVSAVERHDNSVVVRAGNQAFEGPAAIVTVPLGVLKAGAIKFDPPLPERHLRAVHALGFGVLSKSYFRFSKRNWNAENAFYQFMGTGPGLWSQWFTLPAAAGPIVLAFNPGDRGRTVESMPPGDLMSSARPIISQLFGDEVSPVEVRTSRWTTDPFALGAYSFHAPGSGLDDRRRLQQPIGDRLYLAGEAVGVNNPATVHGAFFSGQYAANQLMNRLHR
jgi:monoamine oxidase